MCPITDWLLNHLQLSLMQVCCSLLRNETHLVCSTWLVTVTMKRLIAYRTIKYRMIKYTLSYHGEPRLRTHRSIGEQRWTLHSLFSSDQNTYHLITTSTYIHTHSQLESTKVHPRNTSFVNINRHYGLPFATFISFQSFLFNVIMMNQCKLVLNTTGENYKAINIANDT